MTRLRDRWEHLVQEAQDNDSSEIYESYDEWLNRIGCNEANDDRGFYGDDTPSWCDEEIQATED